MFGNIRWILLFACSACLLAGLGLVDGRPSAQPGPPRGPTRAYGCCWVVLQAGRAFGRGADRIHGGTGGEWTSRRAVVDSAASARHTRRFLEEFQPALGSRCRSASRVPPLGCGNHSFPQATKLVLCPDGPRRLLLQGACLAGVLGALMVVSHDSEDTDRLQRCLSGWGIREIYAIGTASPVSAVAGVRIVRLENEDAVAAACIRACAEKGPVHTLVVANPQDAREGGGMSSWGHGSPSKKTRRCS